MATTSCQITGLRKDLWIEFRQQCIREGISLNKKVKMLIEAEVARRKPAEGGSTESETERNNG